MWSDLELATHAPANKTVITQMPVSTDERSETRGRTEPSVTGGRGARGLSIGEAARRSGVTAKTIRFYEAEGVVPPPARTPNGYRHYTATDVRRLRFVGQLRRLGLPLPAAKSVAAQAFASQCRTYVRDVAALLERQCSEIDRRVAELLVLRGELTDLTAQARRVEASVPAGRLVAECGACLIVDDDRPLSAPGPAWDTESRLRNSARDGVALGRR